MILFDPMITATEDEAPDNCYRNHLLVNYRWHHAVNDQPKLEAALHHFRLLQIKMQQLRGGTRAEPILPMITAIEADVIVRHHHNYSTVPDDDNHRNNYMAVMGHPPAVDGSLTLKSFLTRLHLAGFHHHAKKNTNHGYNQIICQPFLLPVVLKIDFKSEDAYRLSLEDVSNYLSTTLPSSAASSSCTSNNTDQRRHVWINADILSGPGCKKPSFGDPYEFVRLATTHLHGITLSLGWTTTTTREPKSTNDDEEKSCYTDEMISEMISVASSYPCHVTFAVCAAYFKQSWKVLQRLYYHGNDVHNNASKRNNNDRDGRIALTPTTTIANQSSWTVTLWLSGGRTLSEQERRYIYDTLEGGGADERLRNRTYYDIPDFF